MKIVIKGLDDIVKNIKDSEDKIIAAQNSAINKTAAKAKTLASKEIRAQVNLKAGYVGKHLTIKKSTFNTLTASIWATKRGVLMTRYPHRKIKKGVKVNIKKGGGYRLIGGGFIMTNLSNSGASGIAVRENGKIKMLYSPSVSQVFNTVRDDITPETDKYLQLQFEREIKRRLKL